MEKIGRGYSFLLFLFSIFFLLSSEVIGGTITIKPGRFSHFTIHIPSAPAAGDNFIVRLQAYDIHNNLITDFSETGMDFDIKVSGSAQTEPKVLTASAFQGGSALVSISDKKAETITLSILEKGGTLPILAKDIVIKPNRLDHFTLQAPKEGVAGEPFEVIITALDAYDNHVTSYDAIGNGVVLSSTGKGMIRPDRILPSEFKGGYAAAKVVYEVAENMEVAAAESNKKESGRSGTIKIRPAAPDRFLVTTPETAQAGQGFKLRLEAYDRFNNIIRDYNLVEGDVYIETTGSGVITPSIVPSSEFIDGVAVVDAFYDKTESFSITARTALKREAVKIEGKKEETAKLPVETGTKPLSPEKIEDKPKPPHKVKEKPKKPEIRQKSEIKKEVATARKPEAAPKKESVKKETGPRPYEISDIGIVEDKKKAVLIITSNGPLDHKASLITKDGKKWLSLELSPAVKKVAKIQSLKSSFVGDVVIEEKEGNVLNILLEVLREAATTYEVKRANNSVVVTFAAK